MKTKTTTTYQLTEDEANVIDVYRDLKNDPDLNQPFLASVGRHIEYEGGKMVRISIGRADEE